MFSQLKLILAGLSSVAVGIFIYLFKARGEKIEQQSDKIDDLEQEIKVTEIVDVVTEEVEESYRVEQLIIEEAHDQNIKKIYKTSDKPLSPSLLDKLRNIDGLQDEAHRSSK